MSPGKQPLDLVRYLPGVRLRRWADAFADWLKERERTYSPVVPKSSAKACREFLGWAGKLPWEVEPRDVEAYIAWLKRRGLKAGTILIKLGGLSKFYEYCGRRGIDELTGMNFNPVKTARRPKRPLYEKVNYLSQMEEAKLLEAARNDPSALGKRDYAFLLTVLTSGWKVGEVRRLQWGEVEVEGEQAWLVRQKGERTRRVKLTETAWEAIRAYMEAAGRSAGTRPEAYVFAPSAEALVREAGKRREDWAEQRPLSADQARHLLRLYGRVAGLKAEKITYHSLRHTTAMRLAEAGKEAEEIRSILGMQSTNETRDYLKRLRNQPKKGLKARKGARWIIGQAPSRGPNRAKEGDQVGLKHGQFARSLPELEALEQEGEKLEGLDWALVRQRMVVRRLMDLFEESDSTEDKIRYLDLASVGIAKAGKLIQIRHAVEQAERELARQEERRLETRRKQKAVGHLEEDEGEDREPDPEERLEELSLEEGLMDVGRRMGVDGVIRGEEWEEE